MRDISVVDRDSKGDPTNHSRSKAQTWFELMEGLQRLKARFEIHDLLRSYSSSFMLHKNLW